MQTLPPLSKEQKKVLLLSSLGGVLEFYDFIIYIFLTPFIEKIFFANSTAYIATLKTLAIFSVGYLFRPLGGILFSHFGDRYGRKAVFILTVIFMAFPSLAIGLLPEPSLIGEWSPILLLVFRIMQGLALGGEIPAAITFVAEHAGEKRRGFALGVLFFGINMGLLLGSLVTTLLTWMLPEEQIVAYAWRLPFILGGVFGFVAVFLRRSIQETQAFKSLGKQELQRIPFVTLIKSHSLQVIEGLMLVALGSVTIFFYLYWPQYLHQFMHYDYANLMLLNTVGTLILSCTIIVGGVLGDRYGYRFIYLYSALGIIIMAYPLFYLFNSHNLHLAIGSYVLFSLIFGLIPSAYSAILCGLFPTNVRYSGVALSYNLASAIFGGLSPVSCTLLIHHFNSILAPAFYLIGVAVLAGLVCYIGSRTQGLKSKQPLVIM